VQHLALGDEKVRRRADYIFSSYLRMPALARPPIAAPCRCSLSDRAAADRARARVLKKSLAEFAAEEKSYVKSQFRWFAKQHARVQAAVKKAVEEYKSGDGDDE
jgi:hypothetical protein